jgi:hypothetical protein
MKLREHHGFKVVTVFLNTDDLYSEALHCAKSTLEKLENPVAIVGSG